jgi:hypothetical protein
VVIALTKQQCHPFLPKKKPLPLELTINICRCSFAESYHRPQCSNDLVQEHTLTVLLILLLMQLEAARALTSIPGMTEFYRDTLKLYVQKVGESRE